MGGNAVDEGPSTSKGAYNWGMLIIQNFIEDMVNSVNRIVDDNIHSPIEVLATLSSRKQKASKAHYQGKGKDKITSHK